MAKNIKRNKSTKNTKAELPKDQQDPKLKQLRDEMLVQLERLVEYHPARRFSQNLRSLVLEFLMYDGSTEAEYLQDLAIDLTGLFDLLDAIELVQGVSYYSHDRES